ncbi:MAG: PLP-dependent aminotransferase family protein [Clostridiales Family XIII bacterium]|jgi:GntR family transcriptional regulator/MocR family aminotransferase|nr:PLP-dependent aminotransferase family protein [Clostridiales Family XIII bacterium]
MVPVLITVTIEKNSAVPLYEQLYHSLRAGIEHGAFFAGDRLPSKRKLALHLEISQNTVENAYAQLIAEGYLYAIEKSGYFVSALEPYSGRSDAAQADGPAATPRIRENYHAPSAGKPDAAVFDGNAGPPETRGAPAYDLRIDVVDTRHFPYSVWNRLQRKCIGSDSVNIPDRQDYSAQGSLPLRREIARHLMHFKGMSVHPEHIILGAGTEYLFGVLADLLREKTFAIEDPGNPAIKRILDVKGMEYAAIALDPEGLDFRSLNEHGAEAAVIMPAHHFPTGVTMSVNRKRQLLKWLADDGSRVLIEDDFDSEFRHSLRPTPTLFDMGEGLNVVYLNSFTRTIAPSLRVAYMILPVPLHERYRRDMSLYSSTVSEFEQRTLELFLSEGYFERHIMRMRKVYRRRRDEFAAALAVADALPGIEVIPPKCGLVFGIRSDKFSAEEIIRRAYQNGAALYPTAGYYFRAPPPRGAVLAGFAGLRTEELKIVGALLTEALSDL